MKSFNLNQMERAISTQYTDFKGIAAIDTHDGAGLADLAKDYGIDTDRYFVYGASCYDSEPIGKRELSVNLLLIDGNTYGRSFDEISRYQGTVEIETRQIQVPYSDLGKYIKRVNIGVVSSLSAHINAELSEEL